MHILRWLLATSIIVSSATGLQSCKPDDSRSAKGRTPDDKATTNTALVSIPLNYNFYLETSLSTDAYLAPSQSRFKTAINALESYLNSRKNNSDSFNIWEVSSIPYRVVSDASDAQINSYFSGLSSASINQRISKAKGANRNSSDLASAITTIIERSSPNDISILVSDCVVDTKTNGSNLASQQSHLQNVLASKSKEMPLAALIIRDSSEFVDGTYYPPDGGQEKINGYRPYFILIMGPPQALKELADNLSQKFEMFRQLVLLGSKQTTPPAKLQRSNLGHYSVEEGSEHLVARNAERGGPGNKFVLLVEVDLSKIPTLKEYGNNPENYQANGYSVAIESLSDGQYTHLFQLSSSSLGPDHTVRLSLLNRLPSWVNNVSSTTSGTITNNPSELSRTYGVSNLIQGIADGLNSSQFVFELEPIQVKR